jgi:carboxylate-amine ligase
LTVTGTAVTICRTGDIRAPKATKEVTVVTFGIEEEFQILHPKTLRPVDAGSYVVACMKSLPAWRDVTYREFLASQIEHASVVFEQMADARTALTGFRRTLAQHASDLGVVVAGVGTPPDTTAFPSITEDERYHRIAASMAGMVADHQVSGLHVHVGIPSRDAGVIVMNAVRPWMPLFTAIAANSPLWRGRDTGHDSWRTVLLRRWPASGGPPSFLDAADYDRRTARLLGIGGTVDLAVITWNVRLSEHVPTVEFRMADAQLDTGRTLLIAALCRAFVSHALNRPAAAGAAATASAAVPDELLSAALLHSAHCGMREQVFDPATGALAPALDCLDGFVRMLEPELAETGDAEFVAEELALLAADGTGADRQRAAFRRGGIPELGRLLSTVVASDRSADPAALGVSTALG